MVLQSAFGPSRLYSGYKLLPVFVFGISTPLPELVLNHDPAPILNTGSYVYTQTTQPLWNTYNSFEPALCQGNNLNGPNLNG